MLKILKLSKQVLIHGLVLVVTLVVIQSLLDAFQLSFLLFMPPIGFALFLLIMFGFQPIIMGVLNIVALHRLYDYEGWQIGFWLNGFFLLLFFSTVNLLVQTIVGVPFSVGVGIIEILLLSYPFGYLGKFSNRGCKKSDSTQQSVASWKDISIQATLTVNFKYKSTNLQRGAKIRG